MMFGKATPERPPQPARRVSEGRRRVSEGCRRPSGRPSLTRRASAGRSGRRGALAAEFAILLPFIAFCFCFAVDYCRVYHATVTCQQCAEAGALNASGACDPPEYRAPEGGLVTNLLGGVGDLLGGLLGGDSSSSSSGSSSASRTKARDARAIAAAVADGAALNPPLKAEQVSIARQAGMVTVTVEYDVELLTPILDGSRFAKVVRKATLPSLP